MLRRAKTIAIVGLSAERQKASYFVATYLQYEGYRVIPVNPRGGTILGETVYADLKSIPEPVDLVDVFRPAGEVPAIV
jgi:predicted CoA-binding protein